MDSAKLGRVFVFDQAWCLAGRDPDIALFVDDQGDGPTTRAASQDGRWLVGCVLEGVGSLNGTSLTAAVWTVMS